MLFDPAANCPVALPELIDASRLLICFQRRLHFTTTAPLSCSLDSAAGREDRPAASDFSGRLRRQESFLDVTLSSNFKLATRTGPAYRIHSCRNQGLPSCRRAYYETAADCVLRRIGIYWASFKTRRSTPHTAGQRAAYKRPAFYAWTLSAQPDPSVDPFTALE